MIPPPNSMVLVILMTWNKMSHLTDSCHTCGGEFYLQGITSPLGHKIHPWGSKFAPRGEVKNGPEDDRHFHACGNDLWLLSCMTVFSKRNGSNSIPCRDGTWSQTRHSARISDARSHCPGLVRRRARATQTERQMNGNEPGLPHFFLVQYTKTGKMYQTTTK
jgi:hypothetical protein